MKTTFNNDQVKHVWAQQTQDHGKGNGSTYFNGPTLYSYSTPIAHFYTHKGKRVALITSNSYSNSTRRHIPSVRDIPGVNAFEVTHIGVSAGRAPALPANWIKQNYLDMAASYKSKLEEIAKTKSENNLEWRQNSARELRKNARIYAEFFGLRYDVEKYFPELNEAALAKALAAVAAAKEKNKKLIAKQAKARAIEIKAFLTGKTDKLDYGTYGHATPTQRAEIETHATALWRLGRGNYLPGGATRLRVKGDVIETSRGAEFPVKHGLKALPLIRRVVKTATPWQKNGHQIHLGLFQIDRIEIDGTVVAGCHTVPYDEIEAVAAIIEGKAAQS